MVNGYKKKKHTHDTLDAEHTASLLAVSDNMNRTENEPAIFIIGGFYYNFSMSPMFLQIVFIFV